MNVNTMVSRTFRSGLSKIKKTGAAVEQINAVIDDFFDTSATTSHVIQTIIPTLRFIAKIIPRNVATPLPPLNL